MPIYEYECPKCGVVEVMQKITEDPLKRCPNCHRKVKRLISLNNFHLKGTGWYATDYAQKGNGGKEAAKKEADKSKKASASSSTKSSKTETSDKSSGSSESATASGSS